MTLLSRLASLTALAAALASSAPAEAAPCCMSATAFGVGRLLLWEDFAVGLSTSLAVGLGDFGPDGRYRAWGERFSEIEWRSELWAMAALTRRTSLYARVPGLVITRSAGAIDDTSGGIGDVSLGARFELVQIGEYLELPAIAVTVAVLAPSGRATDASRRPLGSDVTGRGAWTLSAGLSFEITRLPWFIRLDAGVSVPLPSERADLTVDQRLGVAVDLALSGGWEVARDVVLSLVPRLTWGDATRVNGRPLADTDHLDFGLGVAASWRLDPHWTLQAAIDAPIPLDSLGKNQPARVLSTLGLRFGSF